MSIAPHRAKESTIRWYVSRSASRSAPIVSSLNTTPHPKVASGALRSTTTMSLDGSDFFASNAKYSPAGPAPSTPIRLGPLGVIPARPRDAPIGHPG